MKDCFDLHRLHVVTVATESRYYFPYLVESCKRNGHPLEVLAYGDKWEGFNWRFTKLLEFLKTKPDDDIVCVVDGYDVVCTRSLNDLIPTFRDIKRKKKCKMVVSVENHCYVNGVLANIFFGKCNGISLNMGLYMAEVKDMLEIIPNIYNIDPRHDSDDQILFTKYCNLRPNDIYIDKQNELFLTITCSLSDLEKKIKYHLDEEGKEIISYGNHLPFFIHANGFGYLDNIIMRLGYNNFNNDGRVVNDCYVYKQLYSKFIHEKVKFYIFYFFKHFQIYIMIFFFVLWLCYTGYNVHQRK